MIVVFDVDGVLCESKTPIDANMGLLLEELSQQNTIVFLTGGKLDQVTSQIIPHTKIKKPYFVLPLSGADAWIVGDAPTMLWNNNFTPDEKGKLMAGIIKVLSNISRPMFMWGTMVEDRISQITISLLGQDAPSFIKKYYDPEHRTRESIILKLKQTIIDSKEFDFRIGGSTSIDINKKGINKGTMLLKLIETNNWDINNVIFIGDKLDNDGNDYPVIEAGIKSIQVKSIKETKELIRKWLTNEET